MSSGTGSTSTSSMSSRTVLSASSSPSWASTWADIANGGHPRWKVEDAAAHEVALSHITRRIGRAHAHKDTLPVNRGGDERGVPSSPLPSPPHIYCPLAGDDSMVYRMWKEGYEVTAVDLVDTAIEALKQRFDSSSSSLGSKWTRNEWSGGYCWSTERATLYVGDALVHRPEWVQRFDGVYDKDSFGALHPSMRADYCARLAEYCKDHALVYVEVKLRNNHDDNKQIGPPFSLDSQDLQSHYGPDSFEHMEALGSIYPISMPGLQQTAHILTRKPRVT